MSGAVDRFAPIQGTREDEAAELATVEILEERLQRLILTVDTVAEKARQLKYKLGGRKAGIKSRQQVVQQSEGSVTPAQPRHPGYNLKEDLINQFITPARSAVSTVSASQSPRVSETYDDMLSPHSVHELMYSRVESLPKGALVVPRCDLCRRRKKDCVKNATACESCTKKHAKCTWHGISAGEAASLVDVAKDTRTSTATGPANHGPPAGSTPGHRTTSAPWSLGPLQAVTPTHQSSFDANSSLIRRSVEGRDGAGDKRSSLFPGT